MRQNCRPQTVNRPISTRINNVQTAVTAHTHATQNSDANSSLPQLRGRGEHRSLVTTPARYRATGPQVSSVVTQANVSSRYPTNASAWLSIAAYPR